VTVAPQKKPSRLFVITVNLITLVLTVGAILLSDVHPRTLIYAFILAFLGQLILVHLMMAVHVVSRGGPMALLMERLSRRPWHGEKSNVLKAEGSTTPLGLGGYLVLIAGISFLALVFTHVNPQRELDFSWKVFGDEIAWAMILAVVYLIQDLFSRSIVIDFKASIEVNMGYNNQETWILGCASLMAGVVVIIRQAAGLSPSGWVLLAPLVVLRHWADLHHDLQFGRRPASEAVNERKT